MEKEALRKKYKALRNQLTDAQIEDYSLAIANQLLTLDIWDYTYYHLFLPISKLREVNTEYILNILQGKDKQVIISKSDFAQNTMTHFLLTDATKLVVNAYGIPEPEGGIEIVPQQIEVVFVPLLAYDLKGNRVGYGKGFYDRFLAECNENTLKIGLSFFEPEQNEISVIDTDLSLNYILSKNKTYKI